MTLKFSMFTFPVVVCGCMVLAVAQDPKPLAISEKAMAARLLTHETPTISKSPLANRCSNALAVVHVVVDTDGKVSSDDFVVAFRS